MSQNVASMALNVVSCTSDYCYVIDLTVSLSLLVFRVCVYACLFRISFLSNLRRVGIIHSSDRTVYREQYTVGSVVFLFFCCVNYSLCHILSWGALSSVECFDSLYSGKCSLYNALSMNISA